VSLFTLGSAADVGSFNPIKMITGPLVDGVKLITSQLPQLYDGVARIVLGLALIILSITYMGKIMKSLMVGRAKEILQNSLGRGAFSGISSGTIVSAV
jgi:sodium-dependent phosphate cotransporter